MTGPGYFDHPSECVPVCKERAIQSPLDRDRPPDWPCPHCRAPAGVACKIRGRLARPLAIFGRFHPSRMEAA